MDKADLCTHMVRHFATSRLALRRADAREFLDELRRLCERKLVEVGQFSVPGVAKLVVETRRARKGRSPVTGQAIVIPARRVVRARIGKKVREAVERPI
ncbi:MAG: HU family DNA-binding protein [Acidobacteria bacterium]|nr:HU family DNA-binding protein [Acidobacteriota bacterium]